MKLPHVRKMEAIGLGILLLAAGMQMFTLWNQNNLLGAEFYRLNERLYVIWNCSRELIENRENGQSICSDGRTIADWHRLTQFDKNYKKQVSAFNWVYVFLYVAGSLMLVFGKYIDSTHESHSKMTSSDD